MAGLTTYFGNLVLTNYFVPNAKYLALHTSDPGANGSAATEFTGGGYARATIAWSVPSNRSTANTGALRFLNLSVGTITHFGLWDAVTGGNCVYAIPLASALTVIQGQILNIPVNDIAVVLN